jgi:hypothetical protein
MTDTEHAIETRIDDTPLAPAAEQGAPPPPDSAPAREAPAAIGVDRAALGRKFAAQRRAQDEDIAFAGSFAPDELRAGHLTQDSADPSAASQAEPPPDGASDDAAPRKHRLVVRREEREVDDDELRRLAQIGAAGESYLAETKSLRDEAAALRNIAAQRPHPDDDDPADTDAPPNAGDPLQAIVEKIQYGPPEEAADALREVIARAQDPEATRKAIYLHQRDLDVNRAKAAYQAFAGKRQNADLLNDRRNELVLQDLYYDEIARDLRALGLPAEQIPQDRTHLVETHRFHRIHGQRVRDTTALLEASRDAFLDWRGPRGAEQNPAAQPRGNTISVSVDRSARRAAIPQQPARAAAPQHREASRQVPSSRSAAVDKMLHGRRRAIVT